ncbi:MAG: DUF4007 family protein [Solobacterium sp.]|nr:DUF4007 family protein [Solobacterium sp.]
MTLKLKKHETFYIRDGWFEKALNTIEENEGINIFFKNDGVKYLGIGANMVKGLKYWLKAAGLIDDKSNKLTDSANIILENDRYLGEDFTWFFIHYCLVSNKEECPVFNSVFNSGIGTFSKADMLEYLDGELRQIDNKVSLKSIEADFNVLIQSYVREGISENPEDNYRCPLSSLKLIAKEKGGYKMEKPKYLTLSYLLIYYALLNLYPNKDSFEIDESMEKENSPVKIFNLDKYMYLQYLDEMRKSGLVTINKTAGLNTVYFEQRLTLKEIFEKELGGE